jgi:cell division protein FtsQ
VTEENHNTQSSRSWRDIPQEVKPRAMSRGGKWRRVLEAVRKSLVIGSITAAAGTLMWIGAALGTNGTVPAVPKSGRMKPPELRTEPDGVLDQGWLVRTLALPGNATLTDLDLEKLRARLLADAQVTSARLTRHFPDKLIVTITERKPVARVRVETGGEPRDLLVAADGVVFAGQGFEPAALDTLPWLAGVVLVPDGRGFKPIQGMANVARLLDDAEFVAGHLRARWQSISLAALESDHELTVTTKEGTTIIFGVMGDFFQQLNRLDAVMERLERLPGAQARIDLSLGREVPVKIEQLPQQQTASVTPSRQPRPTEAASARFILFPGSQPNTKREL